MSKPGMVTYISINKIRRVVPLCALVLVVVLDFFLAFGPIFFCFFLFRGGEMDSEARLREAFLVGCLIVIVSSI
jgi:hypothetical protein